MDASAVTRHVITRMVLGFKDAIEIAPDSYARVVSGKTAIGAMLDLEENFAIVVDNYAEYEQTLLDLSMSKMLRFDFGWSSMRDDVQSINRRLANLLAAA